MKEKTLATAGLHAHPTALEESGVNFLYAPSTEIRVAPPKENEVLLPGERELLFSSQEQQMHSRIKVGVSKEEKHMFLAGVRGLWAS